MSKWVWKPTRRGEWLVMTAREAEWRAYKAAWDLWERWALTNHRPGDPITPPPRVPERPS